MVRKPSQRSSSIKVIKIAALILLGVLLVAFITYGTIKLVTDFTTEPAPTEETTPEPEPEPEPEPIDFQAIMDSWMLSITGDAGAIIYDLDEGEVLAEHRADEDFYTASLYKLFVVYEGYRRIEAGADNPQAVIANGYTRLKCLDLAIRESYSPCAETIWAGIGHSTLDQIIVNDYNITHSKISSLVSTPRDIMLIMKRFWEHPDFSDSLWELAADSFLNQPVTSYDWRQGLPSGFSSKVKVYNKVGWDRNRLENYWKIYDDAAIVEFPELDKRYIVVVMSNRVDHKDIAKFGTMIEETVANR